MDMFKQMAEAVIAGDAQLCVSLAERVVAEKIDPVGAIQKGFSAGMDTVGADFESGRMFLPEMMQAAEAMNAGVAVLKPAIEARGDEALSASGRVVLATIQGDMHDIGKNIVKLLLSTSGFEIVDLGKDVRVDTIIDKAEGENADIVGVSALMTTTMGYMPELIEEMKELGIRDQFAVMVGGAPVTEEWADGIGADGYSKDAVGAVRVARDLVRK
jgi:corrinoid protein of di/trimethylamine methyltransferase